MNIISLLILELLVLGLSYSIPDYNKALIYLSLGVIVPYVIKIILLKFQLLKLSQLSEWFMFYIIGLCYTYYTNNYTLLIFFFGAVVLILLSFITGNNVIIFKPFKYIRLDYALSSYVTGILLVSAVAWYMQQRINLTLLQWLLIYITGVIFVLLNIQFFIRLKTLIQYIFKLNIKELEDQERVSKINLLLKEISPLWTKKQAILKLENLAQSTWLSKEVKQPVKVWEFINSDIVYFWENYINNKNIYSELFKNVIGESLTFLDKYGDCPSVVKEQSKSFGKYGNFDEQTTYDILYGQSLTNHVISICHLIFKDTKKNETISGVNLEKLLITALCHDLGKAAIYNEGIINYRTGDHPNASIAIIERDFTYFHKLDYNIEVSKMIKNHHGAVSPDTPLLKDFREYDSKARREYLTEYSKQSIASNNNKDTSPAPTVSVSTVNKETNKESVATVDNNVFIPSFVPSVDSKTTETSISVGNSSSEIEKLSTTDGLYIDLSNNSEAPDYYKISDFFNINEYLKKISKNLNIIENGKFSYITVNGDLVLCYTGAVQQELKIAARKNQKLNFVELSDKEICMSFTEYCRKLGILHTDWIKDGYFQGNFKLTDINGNKIMTGRYIPLRFSAFEDYGEYDEFNSRKKGKLENIVNAEVAGLDEMEQAPRTY